MCLSKTKSLSYPLLPELALLLDPVWKFLAVADPLSIRTLSLFSAVKIFECLAMPRHCIEVDMRQLC